MCVCGGGEGGGGDKGEFVLSDGGLLGSPVTPMCVALPTSGACTGHLSLCHGLAFLGGSLVRVLEPRRLKPTATWLLFAPLFSLPT